MKEYQWINSTSPQGSLLKHLCLVISINHFKNIEVLLDFFESIRLVVGSSLNDPRRSGVYWQLNFELKFQSGAQKDTTNGMSSCSHKTRPTPSHIVKLAKESLSKHNYFGKLGPLILGSWVLGYQDREVTRSDEK